MSEYNIELPKALLKGMREASAGYVKSLEGAAMKHKELKLVYSIYVPRSVYGELSVIPPGYIKKIGKRLRCAGQSVFLDRKLKSGFRIEAEAR